MLGESLPQMGDALRSMAQSTPTGPALPVTEALPKTMTENPLLRAAQAATAQGLAQSQVTSPQSEGLQSLGSQSSTLQSPTAAQTGQAMLGGSVFQELTQKSQNTPGIRLDQSDGPKLFSGSEDADMTLQELPEAFQEAKSVWTQVDARPATLEQTTETLSDLQVDDTSDSSEGETELLPTGSKSTRPLYGNQASNSTQALSQTSSGNSQVVAEVSQEQSLESRFDVRTSTQNIMMQEVAATPEGHVPALTEVMVEVDDDLRVGVKTNGSEVAVSIDGTTRAVEEMRHIGPELQESLENLGFTLSEFTTNDEDGDLNSENTKGNKENSASSSDSTRSGAQSNRQVRHGMRVDTTCLLYTSPSPRDATLSRMPSSA